MKITTRDTENVIAPWTDEPGHRVMLNMKTGEGTLVDSSGVPVPGVRLEPFRPSHLGNDFDASRAEIQALEDQLDKTIAEIVEYEVRTRRAFENEVSRPQKQKQRVEAPPGHLSQRILLFFFSRKNYDEVFAQLLADGREEYCEALFVKESKRARWIKWRLRLTVILTAISLCVPFWTTVTSWFGSPSSK